MALLKHWNSKLLIPLLTLLTFGAGVGITLLIHNYESENRHALDREHAVHAAEEIATDFEREINNVWAFSSALSAYVAATPDVTQKQLSRFSSAMVEASPFIRSLSLAKDNVITHVYPYEENKKALGLDYMKNVKQKDAVERLIRERQPNIAGPVDLVQGGKAFILRRPVFFTNEESGLKEYWGIASLLINHSDLTNYLSSHIYTKDYDVQWYIFNPNIGQTEILFSTLEGDTEKYNFKKVNLPSETWYIGTSGKQTSSSTNLIMLDVTGILTALLVAYLVNRLLVSHKHNRDLALYDHLTNLPNRRLLNDRFRQLVAQATRQHIGFHLIYIDLNNFKQINDTLGHNVGDNVLKEVACRLQSHVRGSDTVARIGGDEFIVLSEVTDSRPPPSDMIEKLHQILKEPMTNLNDLEVNASFGSAHYSTHGTTLSELMRHADHHMYVNKQRGKEKLTQPDRPDNVINLKS
jgi:diguanylate cyclase (GGDEF)-like protein